MVATERQPVRVRQARHVRLVRRQPDRLAFIDETSMKTNLTWLRGHVLRGRRLEMNVPFGNWGTPTFIAGLTCDTLIAPWVIGATMDGAAFAAYIRKVLVPEVAPGTAAILATHRNTEATNAIRRAECWFLYLPPYSLDLNPKEQAFSKLKAHLRKIGARTLTYIFAAPSTICRMFTQDEC